MRKSVQKIHTETANNEAEATASENHRGGAVQLDFLLQTQHSCGPSGYWSHDTAPCDFGILAKMKMLLKGTHFELRETTVFNALAWLTTIQKEAF